MPRTKQKPARSAKVDPELDRILDHLERAAKYLNEESPRFQGLLPDIDAMQRTARRMAAHLNPDPVAVRQEVARNLVRVLASKANPKEGGALALQFLEDAFDATEDLATRAAYLVGCAVGVDWGGREGMRIAKAGAR
jgi:hypothetical protein